MQTQSQREVGRHRQVQDTWGRPGMQEHMDRHMDTGTQSCKDTQLCFCPFHHAPACIKRLLCVPSTVPAVSLERQHSLRRLVSEACRRRQA